MRKNLASIVAAVFIAAILLAYLCTFQVRSTEVAVLKTWGKPAEKPISGETDAGLHFKLPPPIQTAVLYDSRLRILEDKTEETRTSESKNIVLTTYTVWKIVDPAKFHKNFPGGEEEGATKLRTTIATVKHAVTGRHTLPDFISTDPGERKLRQIEDEMRAEVAHHAQAEYGIEIRDFGVKKLGLPQSTTTEIFAAMKASEQSKASRYQTEGDAQAKLIMADAENVRRRILAAAQEKKTEIESAAQEKIGEVYKEFSKYPELRIFLDELRTLREALLNRATIILDTQSPPARVMDPNYRATFIKQEPAAGAGGVQPAADQENKPGPETKAILQIGDLNSRPAEFFRVVGRLCSVLERIHSVRERILRDELIVDAHSPEATAADPQPSN